MRITWWRMVALLMIACSFLLATRSHAGTNSKSAELQSKIADISLLQRQLLDRQRQIETLRSAVQQQQRALVDEIMVLKKSLGLDSYVKAQQQTRVRYNLELLCLITAYNKELEAKWTFYQSGQSRLNYLRQSAEDDIKMISTLNDLKIDALTTQISLVINRYLPDAHVIQIDPQSIVVPLAQAVWDQLAVGTNK